MKSFYLIVPEFGCFVLVFQLLYKFLTVFFSQHVSSEHGALGPFPCNPEIPRALLCRTENTDVRVFILYILSSKPANSDVI